MRWVVIKAMLEILLNITFAFLKFDLSTNFVTYETNLGNKTLKSQF